MNNKAYARKTAALVPLLLGVLAAMPWSMPGHAQSRPKPDMAGSHPGPRVPGPTDYRPPSQYFTYFHQDSAGAPWVAGTGNAGCRGLSGLHHAVRIVALSGDEVVIDCHRHASGELGQVEKAARERLETSEIRRAAESRSGLDAGSQPFTSYTALQALLKHDPDIFDDRAWTALAKDEIRIAQSSLQTANGASFHDWVFPPTSLQGRNPDIAAGELVARFKQTVLERAKSNPDRFILRIMAGNLKYDAASGTLQFGRTTGPGQPITVLQPLNLTYKGHQPYSLGANQGLAPYAVDQVRTAGLRSLAAAGRVPTLILDRTLLLHGFQIPKDQAERLLNKTQMLLVNVVLTVTDAERDPNKKGISLYLDSFLSARVEQVFVTDYAGTRLATYPVASLPVPSVGPSARTTPPRQGAAPSTGAGANPLCAQYEKRMADARTKLDPRLIESARKLGERLKCGPG